MNRFEIRDILNQHKEHFRVLPTNAMNDLVGIIRTIDEEVSKVVEPEPEKPSELGKGTRKSKKKSARSKR